MNEGTKGMLLSLLFKTLGAEREGEEVGKARLRSWPPWIILGLLFIGKLWLIIIWLLERFKLGSFKAEKVGNNGGFRSGTFEDDDEVDEEEDEVVEELVMILFLFFLEPPPTGMFLRDPPSVQYLLQVLQKYLGCVRL